MDSSSSADRYLRQRRFGPFGDEGQARLASSRVLLCGCGALGSVIAERLARAGVGHLRIIDRDWVELTNLQRQTLFTEQHAKQAMPKAVAAVEVLSQINSQIRLEPVVEDLTCANIDALGAGSDLVMDGTDNFETRLLINDYCLKHSVPWIHGGCLGASGQLMTIIPGKTACFRCLVPDLPPPDSLPTCDTAGVPGASDWSDRKLAGSRGFEGSLGQSFGDPKRIDCPGYVGHRLSSIAHQACQRLSSLPAR